jgi:UDP-N-acetyl-D-galactosamine dehydrogenase
MGPHTARQVVKKIIASGKDIAKSKVLVMGATFKENVSDIRNSKVSSVVNELKSFGVEVEVHDAYASSDEVMHEYGFELIPQIINQKYDSVIVAVNHKQYLEYTEDDFANLLTENGVLVDLKGVFRGKISKLNYWSL